MKPDEHKVMGWIPVSKKQTKQKRELMKKMFQSWKRHKKGKFEHRQKNYP